MVLCATVGLLLTACSVTRKLQPGEYYLQRVEIHPDKETLRNERIRVDTAHRAVEFFIRLMKQC